MVDDLEFFYSGGLNKEPRQKEGFFEKVKKFIKEKIITENQLKALPRLLSKKERYLILTLSLIIIGSLISIPIGYYFNLTEAKPDFGGSFREGLWGEPRFINPILLQMDTDRDLARLIYSGLLKNDGKGNFVPDLAENYNISGDGLTYRFTLRNNVRWHDGKRFIAEDVVFTIRTVQNSDFASPQRINWQGIEVNKLDDFTVEFKLKNPYAQFLNNLTLGILPHHLWQEVKPANLVLSELNLKPVGTGPYKFFKLKKNKLGRVTSYELAADENYFLGRPFIDSIEFKFYSSEEEMIQSFNLSGIDSIGGISPDKIKDLRFPGKVEIEKVRIPRYFAIFFNQNKSAALSDKNIRLALAHSVSKDAVLEGISGNGLKIESPVLPEIFEQFNKNFKIYDYNPDFARKILDNSGWLDRDGDGVREKGNNKLELEFVVPSRPEFVKIAAKIKQDWEKNIGAKINLMDAPTFELQQNYIQPRNYQLLLFGEVLGLDPDPFSFWHSSQKKDPGLNLALYDNKGADKLLEEARQTLNPVSRAAKYNDFQNLVIEDLPAIFLYSPLYLYPKDEDIKGIDIELLALPSERFVNVHEWYIETKRVRK